MARFFALVTFVVLALLTGGGLAHAHGGPIKLEVQGDGGQGVNATVTYKNDGHMVTDEVVMSYTAVSPDGQTFGPVRMIASAEGQSFYRGEKPLPLGKWTVTMTATHPSQAQQTVAVTSADLPAAQPPPAPSGSPVPTMIIILAVAVAGIAATTALLLRRRPVRVR